MSELHKKLFTSGKIKSGNQAGLNCEVKFLAPENLQNIASPHGMYNSWN